MDNVGENVKFESSKTIKFPKKEKRYPVIKVPASGRPDWGDGARTMCFVFSRDNGNFILEGYRGEVEEYLKANYKHYFCYYSMWYRGRSRGIWRFWKENVGIFGPSKIWKSWKYQIRKYSGGYNGLTPEETQKDAIYLKRMPHQWIPEFNRF